MQKKTLQRDSFQKRSGFTSFFMVDKEASKALKLVLDYLWILPYQYHEDWDNLWKRRLRSGWKKKQLRINRKSINTDSGG